MLLDFLFMDKYFMCVTCTMCYRWGWNIGNHTSCGGDDNFKRGVSNSMKMIVKKSTRAKQLTIVITLIRNQQEGKKGP
jgi:hypothetical protein